MKHYIWIVSIVVIVGANASENPFDLNSNLKKIDQAENSLFGELQKTAKTEDEEDEFIDSEEETKDKISVSPNETNVTKEKKSVVLKDNVPEEDTIEEKTNKLSVPDTESVQIETRDARTLRLKKEKEKADDLSRIAKIQEEKQAEADALVKLRTEKIMLEKKLAEEKAIKKHEKQIMKKVVDVNISKEHLLETEEAKKRLDEAIKEVDQED